MIEPRFDPEVFRLYDPETDGFMADGYPTEWHASVKGLVKTLAGFRCERCGHPYRKGMGEWSPCDDGCSHTGPGRHLPMEVDRRVDAEQRPGWDPIVGPDGWVTFDSGDVGWLVDRGVVVEARWRILTVHHLNGIKGDLRWWNLAALCQRCHLQIQGKVRLEQTYPWEHSDWFKLHAAGWYAFAYLDKDVSFEEAEDHLEEFLALERADKGGLCG